MSAACDIMDGLRFVTSLKQLNIGYVATCDIGASADIAASAEACCQERKKILHRLVLLVKI